MSLTKAQVREILSSAGVDAERIAEATEKIISGHTSSIEALREERDTWKTEAGKVAGLEREKADLESKLKGYEGKDYDALKKEYDEYKDGVEKRAVRSKKEGVYTEILNDLGIDKKYHERILKFSDVDGVEFDDTGKPKNAKDIRDAISKDWSDHIKKTETHGAKNPTPPEGDAGEAHDTSAATERVAKYMAERYGNAVKKEE